MEENKIDTQKKQPSYKIPFFFFFTLPHIIKMHHMVKPVYRYTHKLVYRITASNYQYKPYNIHHSCFKLINIENMYTVHKILSVLPLAKDSAEILGIRSRSHAVTNRN